MLSVQKSFTSFGVTAISRRPKSQQVGRATWTPKLRSFATAVLTVDLIMVESSARDNRRRWSPV